MRTAARSAWIAACFLASCNGEACGARRPSTTAPSASASTVSTSTADRDSIVDGLVEAAIGAGGPGAAVVVIERGKVVRSRGYGYANVASRTKITAHTTFDLASVSKQFTAAVVMLLVERKKVSLDEPVDTYLRDLPRPHPARPIRVVDLLHMTSGLPDYTAALEDFGEAPTLTNEQIVTWAAEHEKAWRSAGGEWAYCNTNYVLLAAIAERVTGKPFAELLATEIFVPLHMSGTTVLDEKGKTIPERAQGYSGLAKPEAVREDVPCTGDGNVFSSIDDLVKWDAALRAGTLLKPSSWKTMTTEGALDDGSGTGYGCGLGVENDHGRLVEHSGVWTGTSTWIGRWLDDDRTVIVLSNLEDLDAEALGRAIAVAMRQE